MRIIRIAGATFAIGFLILLLFCKSNNTNSNNMNSQTDSIRQGSFAYDIAKLKNNVETIILQDSSGESQIAIVPAWQARVMTSTASGNDGFSYGWLNYQLIESGAPAEHINAFGGEERLWLGPEGGPYSIYFKAGVEQEFANWYVPKELDTEAFGIVEQNTHKVVFTKSFNLTNYSGTKFDLKIERTVSLLNTSEMQKTLGITLPQVKVVAYESRNSLYNNGNTAWSKQTGLLSIWMLSMLSPSPGVTIFIPYNQSKATSDSKVVNDDYFGKVPADRLKVQDGTIWFKVDGKLRSKIGVPPQFAVPFSGSYDAVNGTLTILWCDLPKDNFEYVNSKWGEQANPFEGDAINSYNDGPADDGTIMGPFYELESSSPAAILKPNEHLTHRQRIFHFEGSDEQLSVITQAVFGISVEEIKKVW